MKINFDGVVFSSENVSGIGVVIRNHLGLVIASCSQHFPQAYSGNEVEALVGTKLMLLTFQIFLVWMEDIPPQFSFVLQTDLAGFF